MKDDLITTLSNAVNTGEAVRIIYHGGSQPGSAREISPIIVTSHEVRARDLSTGIVKVFLLSKIELFGESVNIPIYDPNAPPKIEEIKTIEQAFASKVSELQNIGWHVVLTQDVISLYSYFKNGNIRKTPDILLRYDEFTVDISINLATNEIIEEKHKSIRPYRLSSKSLSTAHTFSHMSKALELFFSEAKLNAPSNVA